jgi:hypothetical protein
MLLTTASTAVQAGATIAGGRIAETAGAYTRQASEFTARQHELQAGESRAAAQRMAADKRRESRLVQSQLVARAAASGGAVDDPSVVTTAGQVAQRGEYEALTEMYKGENRARGLEDAAYAARRQGEAAEYEGKAKKKASYLSALGTIIGGASTMYRTYNKLPEPRYG